MVGRFEDGLEQVLIIGRRCDGNSRMISFEGDTYTVKCQGGTWEIEDLAGKRYPIDRDAVPSFTAFMDREMERI